MAPTRGRFSGLVDSTIALSVPLYLLSHFTPFLPPANPPAKNQRSRALCVQSTTLLSACSPTATVIQSCAFSTIAPSVALVARDSRTTRFRRSIRSARSFSRALIEPFAVPLFTATSQLPPPNYNLFCYTTQANLGFEAFHQLEIEPEVESSWTDPDRRLSQRTLLSYYNKIARRDDRLLLDTPEDLETPSPQNGYRHEPAEQDSASPDRSRASPT